MLLIVSKRLNLNSHQVERTIQGVQIPKVFSLFFRINDQATTVIKLSSLYYDTQCIQNEAKTRL